MRSDEVAFIHAARGRASRCSVLGGWWHGKRKAPPAGPGPGQLHGQLGVRRSALFIGALSHTHARKKKKQKHGARRLSPVFWWHMAQGGSDVM
jgi:hypothetical protein